MPDTKAIKPSFGRLRNASPDSAQGRISNEIAARDAELLKLGLSSARSATEEITRGGRASLEDRQRSVDGHSPIYEARTILDFSRKDGPGAIVGRFRSHGKANGLSLSTSREQCLTPAMPALMTPLTGSEPEIKEVFGAVVRIEVIVLGALEEVEAMEHSSNTGALRCLHRAMLKELGTLQRVLQNITRAGEEPWRRR